MVPKVPQISCAGNEGARVGRMEKEDKTEMVFRNEVAVEIEVFQKYEVELSPLGETGEDW